MGDHPRWSAVLDDLERWLDDAERTLSTIGPEPSRGVEPAGAASSPPAPPLPWAPPTGLGPMPAALSDRASSVLSRQSALVARLVEARSAVQQQLGAVRRVEASHEPGRPVYLDALG
ncbi:hypothetical protein SOM11_05170 [Frigoribacterium sp. CFBP9039]|uniref:hypothetical protein n=1 Tax=Frigoribacterium sp. CFBP9029 TaxID=3096541 RepID=UPI002A6B110B|nr:hypothetical protein [Frigoribacterium sp. CFBP9039]MDY0945373.1 hypothetical protein [Frigoribacterium sp. CFBP9039]